MEHVWKKDITIYDICQRNIQFLAPLCVMTDQLGVLKHIIPWFG